MRYKFWNLKSNEEDVL